MGARAWPTHAGKISWHTRPVARFPAFAAAEDSRATALARAIGAVGAATPVPYGPLQGLPATCSVQDAGGRRTMRSTDWIVGSC